MNMLRAVFPEGVDEIEVSGLTQWDRGQMLDISYSGLPTIYQVHFTFKGASVALMVPALDTTSVEIPDELLQQPRDLVAYIYLIGEDGSGETIKTVHLPLVRRARPEDYTSDLTPTQVEFIESMLASINSKAETAVALAGEAKGAAGAAQASAATSAKAANESANAAAASENAVGNLSVAYETLSYTENVSVQKSTNASGGIHLLFRVPRGATGLQGVKGEPGRGLVILGYYASLDELTSAVTAPAVGDSYGIGETAPYDIYTYDGVGAGWVNNGPLQGIASPALTVTNTATVGQTIRVSAVDETGKPTEWEAVDLASAVYSQITLTDAVSSVEFSLNGATEFSIALKVPVTETGMTYCHALVNGKKSGFMTANIGDTSNERISLFTVKRVGEGIWFIRNKPGNNIIYANGTFSGNEDVKINNGLIHLDIETFGIQCYGSQQLPEGTVVYTISGGAAL